MISKCMEKNRQKVLLLIEKITIFWSRPREIENLSAFQRSQSSANFYLPNFFPYKLMIGVKDHQYKISEKNIERFGHCAKKIPFFLP